MKNSIKNILIIGLSALLLFSQYCSSNNVVDCSEISNTDTLIVERIIERIPDTIFVDIYKPTTVKKTFFPIVEENTITNINTDTNICDYITTFEEIIDNKDIIIRIKDVVRGEIINKKVNYTLKVPRIIERTIKVTDIIEKSGFPQWSLLVGGEIGGNKNFINISASTGIQNKKGNIFYYRKEFLENTHNFGTLFKIFSRRIKSERKEARRQKKLKRLQKINK